MQDLRNELLTLLRNDAEIRNAVREALSAPQEMQELSEDADTLQSRCVRAERALEEAQETIFSQEQRLSALRQQCSRMQEVLAPYARLETVYGHYLELPDDVRDICAAFLNEFSPLSFAVTGAEETTLHRLHEIICTEGTQMDKQTLNTLNACFDLFFDLYLVGHPDFRRLPTREGDKFDPSQHILTPDSLPEGRISKVMIAGFCCDGSETFRKSLVRIG